MTTRRSIIAAIAALVLLGLAGCTTLRTTEDYDRSADFSKLRTFHVKNVHQAQGQPGAPANELMDRRIKSALAAELARKGLRQDDDNPDLWVVPHVRLSHETEIYTWDAGWGYGWRWRGGLGWSASTVERIPIGTLIVDLVDARAKQLVWRGTATDVIDRHATPEEKERQLGEAVARMLRGFPPAPRR